MLPSLGGVLHGIMTMAVHAAVVVCHNEGEPMNDFEVLVVDTLLEHEGMVPWLYCDSRGFVTVGIGNLVQSPDTAACMPLVHKDGAPASPAQKRLAWATVQAAWKGDRTYRHYKELTDLRVTREYAQELALVRLREEFFPALRRIFPDFGEWPESAALAVTDMIYSLGVRGFMKFEKLIAACQGRDWQEAALQCVRRGGTEKRNRWTVLQFTEARHADRRVS